MSKKTTLHVQNTFFFGQFFAVVLHDDNVKLPDTSEFYGRNVVCGPVVHFFFAAAHCHLQWPLAFLIFSPPL